MQVYTYISKCVYIYIRTKDESEIFTYVCMYICVQFTLNP